MNQVANISGLTIEAQPSDVRSLLPEQRDVLIVSIAQVTGGWVVLSLYGDACWIFNNTTTNALQYSRTLRFKSIPAPFIDVVKASLYRFLRRGRGQGVRPTNRTLQILVNRIVRFLNFLLELDIRKLGDATPQVCKLFVDLVKKESHKGTIRGPSNLDGLFRAVEAIHELSQYTSDPMPAHPWLGTSSSKLAGVPTTGVELRASKTPLMPDDAFVRIFQAAWKLVEQADSLLDMRDAVAKVGREKAGRSLQPLYAAKNRRLKEFGWSTGVIGLRIGITNLRTACYIVVASLSGCRNHELAFLEKDAVFTTRDNSGTVYTWMRSTSTKTGVGVTEWMIPEAAVRALKVMERWAQPHQEELRAEIDRRRRADPVDIEIAEAERHQAAIFLGLDMKTDRVRTLSSVAWNVELKSFAASHQISWRFSTHQFRRKFANYAARSRFGDLRYLKEHFKHWSMDMTLAYAMNESQEISLYRDVYEELNDIKEDVIGFWMDPRRRLGGGYGERIAQWRGGDGIALFKDRSAMIRAISESTAIRANGHAWCTADDDLCVGNGGLERTRCVSCSSAVIGEPHAPIYQQLYHQLAELQSCNDIGPGGQARVLRDLSRCKRVLETLGYPQGDPS